MLMWKGVTEFTYIDSAMGSEDPICRSKIIKLKIKLKRFKFLNYLTLRNSIGRQVDQKQNF